MVTGRSGLRATLVVLGLLVSGLVVPLTVSSDSTAEAAGRRPGPVRDLQVKLQRDAALTLSWRAPRSCRTCGKVRRYRLTWPGHSVSLAASSRTKYFAALSNNGVPTRFTIRAVNRRGPGPARSVVGMGAGAPERPAAPAVSGVDTAGGAAKAVTVQWPAVAPNGPGPVTYQVNRTGGAGPVTLCAWTTALTCADRLATDGTSYRYTVTARNAEAESPRERTAAGRARHVSAPSEPTAYVAAVPLPRVTVVKGASAQGLPGCSSPRCRYVVAITSGFPGAVTCRISATDLGTHAFVPWSQGGAATRQSPNYFGGTWIEVTCDGVTSPRFPW